MVIYVLKRMQSVSILTQLEPSLYLSEPSRYPVATLEPGQTALEPVRTRTVIAFSEMVASLFHKSVTVRIATNYLPLVFQCRLPSLLQTHTIYLHTCAHDTAIHS